jgi:metallo-beta-lactamase class B
MPLVKNDVYPSIADDFTHTFAVLESLPCDVFLAEHGSAYDLQGKIAKMKNNRAINPFIDPLGYRDFVNASRTEFENALNDQRKKP